MNHTDGKQAFQDKTLVCCDCGAKFTWGIGEQIYFQDRSLLPPRRCHDCRARRRQTIHPPTSFDDTLEKARSLFPNSDTGRRAS